MKKRRLICFTTTFFILLLLASCAPNTPDSNANMSEAPDSQSIQDTIYFNTEGKILSYRYFSIEDDFEGKPVILLHFEYTNDTDTSHMVSADFFPTVSQNGIELKTGILQYQSEYFEEYSNLITPIKNHTTIPVCFVYSLLDVDSDVEVNVQTFLDFYSDPQKITLSLLPTASDSDASSVSWEKKYYALLSKYKALQKKYEQLEQRLEYEQQK